MIGTKDKPHYILIQKLETLLKSKTKYGKKQLVCPICYAQTRSLKLFQKHMLMCESGTDQTVEMPTDNILNFKNFRYRQPNAITVYLGKIFTLAD